MLTVMREFWVMNKQEHRHSDLMNESDSGVNIRYRKSDAVFATAHHMPRWGMISHL
jgi:hypothetical protein